MIEPYRRHSEDCPFRARGGGFLKCDCRLWGYGDIGGKPFRQSLGTRNLERALERIRQLESGAVVPAPARGKALAVAASEFVADCEGRNVRASTLRNYRLVLDCFAAAAPDRLPAITAETVSQFRIGRKKAASTANKELRVLRTFFAFCEARGWIEDNPAKPVRMALSNPQPAAPLSQAEIDRLFAAVDKLGGADPRAGEWRVRARAVLMVFLYTGLRVSDVALLEWASVDLRSRYITLRTLKNGARVKCRIPPDAVAALDALPRAGQRVFWTGDGLLHTAKNQLRVTIYRLGAHAGVDVHPHRFRDTFACRLLEGGADIRTVQHLLGHESVRTTERHYAQFVASHQALLDSATAALNFAPGPRVLNMERAKG